MSSVSNSESEADSDNEVGAQHERGLRPYMCEPQGHREQARDDVAVGDHRLVNDISWCSCEQCTAMSTPENRVCCQECAPIVEQMSKFTTNNPHHPLKCITLHPGFDGVCLNPYVLETAYHAYRQDYGAVDRDIHEKYRYVAYRQLVRWCWGFLGRHNRVPLPACTMSSIRAAFPAANGHYKQFQWPQL